MNKVESDFGQAEAINKAIVKLRWEIRWHSANSLNLKKRLEKFKKSFRSRTNLCNRTWRVNIMQYQQNINEAAEIYCIFRVKNATAAAGHCCHICGKAIQKKGIVYYQTQDFQLCLSCAEKSRQPNNRRRKKI